MKIALIHYRLILRGGLERRLINYTNDLIQKGHEVHIIVAKNSSEVTFPKSVKIHVLSLGLMPKVFRQRYFDYLLGKFMQQHHFDLSISLMRTSHQDIVLCPGNHLGFLKAMGKNGGRLTDKEQIRSDRLAFQQSRAVVAASQMMADEVTGLYGIDKEKVKLLPPPVNLEEFKFERKNEASGLRNKYGLPQDKRIFLFISSSHKRKGLPLLLELFEQAQDTDAVLVIAGLPPVQSSLKNVIDLQYIKQMEELYAAATFTIHPARYEPFGQIVPESLSSGTPVIISDMCGAKEVVGMNDGLVIPLSDKKAWLNAIRNAKAEDFEINQNYAAQHQLTISAHVDSIINALN